MLQTLILEHEQDTQALAVRMAQNPCICLAIIELRGELGAGKTSWARHLLRALGVRGTIKSPTYAVVEEYSVQSAAQSLHIWHFDFYRFSDPREWEDAGFRDIFLSEGLKISEWPQRAEGYLPQADMRMDFQILGAEKRGIELTTYTDSGHSLLQSATAIKSLTLS